MYNTCKGKPVAVLDSVYRGAHDSKITFFVHFTLSYNFCIFILLKYALKCNFLKIFHQWGAYAHQAPLKTALLKTMILLYKAEKPSLHLSALFWLSGSQPSVFGLTSNLLEMKCLSSGNIKFVFKRS